MSRRSRMLGGTGLGAGLGFQAETLWQRAEGVQYSICDFHHLRPLWIFVEGPWLGIAEPSAYMCLPAFPSAGSPGLGSLNSPPSFSFCHALSQPSAHTALGICEQRVFQAFGRPALPSKRRKQSCQVTPLLTHCFAHTSGPLWPHLSNRSL